MKKISIILILIMIGMNSMVANPVEDSAILKLEGKVPQLVSISLSDTEILFEDWEFDTVYDQKIIAQATEKSNINYNVAIESQNNFSFTYNEESIAYVLFYDGIEVQDQIPIYGENQGRTPKEGLEKDIAISLSLDNPVPGDYIDILTITISTP